MPISLYNGTISASSNELNFHTADTSNHVYVLVVDTTNMVNGDTVEFRIYTIAKPSGAEGLAYMTTYANAQSTPLKYSVPVPADNSFRATIKQTGGTNRNYDWAILTIS